MANIITAGNSTNGGTAITTDTSGTLNIVTGSGSGSNAITIDASQNVTIAGTLTGSSSITGTNLFGQNQTWQSVTRTSGTTYTNTTGRPITVLSQAAAGGSTVDTWTVGGVALPNIVPGSTTNGVISFIVPSGVSYSHVTVGTVTVYELR